jgi:hypothetical protein
MLLLFLDCSLLILILIFGLLKIKVDVVVLHPFFLLLIVQVGKLLPLVVIH